MTERPTLADAAIKTDEQQKKDAEGPSAPVKLVERLKKQPWIAHLIRMIERFGERLGSQFAAAITYFTFLSIVPLLLLAFSIAGFVLAGQPDLLQELRDAVNSITSAGGSGIAESINGVIDEAINNRTLIGIVSVVIALISGLGWMTNVREAVQAMWRPTWEENPDDKESLVKGAGKDLLTLVVLGVGLIVSVALTAVSSALTGVLARLFGLDDIGWFTTLLSIVPIVVAVGINTLLFFFIYHWVPTHTDVIPARKYWRGSLTAAVILQLFGLLFSFLVQLFGKSATAVVFGSLIALLTIINLIARMVLMVAAWIATSVPVEDIIGDQQQEQAVVIRPVYRVRSTPALVGGLGIGAAVAWLTSKARSRD